MITRRGFLKRSVACAECVSFARGQFPSPASSLRSAAATALPAPLVEPKEGETLITILHTNDQHSQIDPLPASDRVYGGKGGVARRATLVKRIRAENANTLLVDAGDVFQGMPS